MKKIILSLSVVAAVAAVVLGATTAFYNDEEISSGNVLAAGAIDLGVDNESYYNGLLNPGTSWTLDYDLDPETNPGGLPRLFFNFTDLKPGDWGEDTISLHVKDNDSWLCADVTLTSNDDNDVTEPEDDEELENDSPSTDPDDDNADGELASRINFYWWADDGDNVYENDEELLNDGGVTFPGLGTYPITLADSQYNIWGQQDGDPAVDPIPGDPDGENVRYIGKAWCFGEGDVGPKPSTWDHDNDLNTPNVDDNRNPTIRPVSCDGFGESNITQTDSMTMDITFRAEQSRHQPDFTCQPEEENGTG